MTIPKHDTPSDRSDIWAALAAPLPKGVISWRQDGKVMARDGKYFARFVAYIEANTARERLDSVVPGEWDLTLELMPPLPALMDGEEAPPCAFKARLQILGCIREDVGSGRDYKAAATDAFKRAAVRFGIAHELYAYEHNWVQMDGDGRNAKPLEDPGTVYARRYGPALVKNEASAERQQDTPNPSTSSTALAPSSSHRTAPSASTPKNSDAELPACPKCGGAMWDNRLTKKNPKQPDYKCKDRGCDGVIWPARTSSAKQATDDTGDAFNDGPLGMSEQDMNDLPF